MKEQTKKRPFRVHPIALIMLAIGSLCFSAAAFWQAYFVPPSIEGSLLPPGLAAGPFDPGAAEDKDAPDTVEVAAENPEPGSTPVPIGRKQGSYTVLLVGTQDDYNTDTIMICHLNTKDGTLNVVSIPRDTKVNTKRSLKKINGAYGESKKKGEPESGINGLISELATLIGFPVDCYAMVDMKAFKQLVDAIDGVDFNVPVNMKKNTGDMMIDLKKGEQHLNGDEALQLMRYRGYNGSGGVDHDDFGRMQMQQEFLKAVAKQTLQIKNVSKIDDFVKIAEENLKTNLNIRHMGWFAQELMKLNLDNINFATLPVNAKQNSQSYLFVKPTEALAMINEMINPFTEEITGKNVVHLTK